MGLLELFLYVHNDHYLFSRTITANILYPSGEDCIAYNKYLTDLNYWPSFTNVLGVQ